MISQEHTPEHDGPVNAGNPGEAAGMPQASSPLPDGPLQSQASSSNRILVVEDDIQSQQYMKILLSRHFAVETSSSAKDAWQLLHEKPIDLVLMDISLHGDIDGLQLTRMIREDEILRALPVIALTAHAFPADREKSIDAGCTDYLSKPFQREQLMTIINKYITH